VLCVDSKLVYLAIFQQDYSAPEVPAKKITNNFNYQFDNLEFDFDYTFFAADSASFHKPPACLYSCSVVCFVLHSPVNHLRHSF
jgi:hypothetical protein